MSKETSCFIVNLRDQQAPVQAYRWTVGDDFFLQAESSEIQRGNVDVRLDVERLSDGAYELRFDLKGHVWVVCDRCLESMCLELAGSDILRAKLGEEDADDGDLITVFAERGTLDLTWNLYEVIILLLPMRRVHAQGKCSKETLDALARLTGMCEQEAEKSTDPRWDVLKGILDNNK